MVEFAPFRHEVENEAEVPVLPQKCQWVKKLEPQVRVYLSVPLIFVYGRISFQ